MVEPDDLLINASADVQAIFHKLHSMIMDGTPEAHQRIYLSQNHISYSLTGSMRDEVIYLVPMKKYVRLGFFWGINLPDLRHRLVGEGKRLRHVKIWTLDEAGQSDIRSLIEAAWKDAASKKKPEEK